jgi:adenine-specific DNA-methyltransferase
MLGSQFDLRDVRHYTQAILETLKSHMVLARHRVHMLGDADLNIGDKLDAYEHTGPWTNRLISFLAIVAGMSSLLEYKGISGQV